MPRENLAEITAHALREQLIDGDLPAGSRINEVELARSLEVSRTPLREALHIVSQDGLIELLPRRGYFVRPLSPHEFRSLYEMRQILDPEALRRAGVPKREVLHALVELNHSIDAADTPARVIELDDEWHRLLLIGCPNRFLLEEIERFMRLTRRYELAYFRARGHVDVALQEHERILSHLVRGELDHACNALRTNMTSGIGPITEWLKDRQ
ncbi:MAG: GntR family transcriptional regulator [Myxococcota bacterium]